ncbi:MAG TPA: rhodanese-like domain-containing protein [Gemmatimonadales bacterium]|nr:rhodanese-like domain-containing protein [Gemmatimonadales bacterium]
MVPTSSPYDPDEEQQEEQPVGRWTRSRGGPRRRWLRLVLLVLVVPLLLGAAVALLAGRPIAFEVVRRLTVRKFPDVRWIDAAEFARWRADPGRPQPVVIDSRTPAEFSASHLKDAARMDPYRPLLRPLRGMPKDTAIVVYSSVGYRSARVAYWLGRQGYTNVYNLDGSLFGWANAGRPLFRDGGPTVTVHPYDERWGLMLEEPYRATAEPVMKRSAAP